MTTIGFAGLSHLGIVSGVAAAAKGFEVVGFDPDSTLCTQLGRGELPIVEPDLPELLQSARDRICFTADAAALAACELIYISVDIPTTEAGDSDLSGVHALVRVAADTAPRDATVVILSQVPPGFTRALLPSLRTPEKELRLHYQVETLIFGRAVERALRPERFIIGCDDPSAPLPALLSDFLLAFGCPILRMRYESAELCKISINMFLVSSVSTTNMLAEICEATGAEWREIAPGLRLDKRVGTHAYLSPGLGIGGGNLERDLATIRTIAAERGTDASLVDTWTADGRYRRDWALRVLHERLLSRIERPSVALWGLAYKEHTQSVKNSPGVHLVQTLTNCTIHAYDPEAHLDAAPLHVTVAPSALAACRDADALVVMTAWPEFARIDLGGVRQALRGPLLVDPLGVCDPSRAAAVGLDHVRLGPGRVALTRTPAPTT